MIDFSSTANKHETVDPLMVSIEVGVDQGRTSPSVTLQEKNRLMNYDKKWPTRSRYILCSGVVAHNDESCPATPAALESFLS